MANAIDIHEDQRRQVRALLEEAIKQDLREVLIIGSGPGDVFWSISAYGDRARVLGQLEILKARVLRGVIHDTEDEARGF